MQARSLINKFNKVANKAKGLRLDAWLPDGGKNELAIDFTGVHPTKASLGTANTNWHMAEWKAEELSTQSGAPSPFAGIPSVVCQRAITTGH